MKFIKGLKLAAFFTVLFTSNSFGQYSLIYGTTATHLPHKYAYLYDPDLKVLNTAEIKDHRFSFKMKKPSKLKILVLSFNSDLYTNYSDVQNSFDFQYPNKTRLVAIEDSVAITFFNEGIRPSVKGGILNVDIDDMYAAIKSQNYENFFQHKRNSPIALLFLKTLAENAIRGSQWFGRSVCKSYYEMLSDDMKASIEGRDILEILSK